MAFFRAVVDHAFTPALERQIEILNSHLKTRGLQAGVDIKWLVEKI